MNNLEEGREAAVAGIAADAKREPEWLLGYYSEKFGDHRGTVLASVHQACLVNPSFGDLSEIIDHVNALPDDAIGALCLAIMLGGEQLDDFVARHETFDS
jgi:hypothetical protein